MSLEINRVITGHCINATDSPGIMTSQPKLQGDTGDGVPVDAPLGSGYAVPQRRK